MGEQTDETPGKHFSVTVATGRVIAEKPTGELLPEQVKNAAFPDRGQAQRAAKDNLAQQAEDKIYPLMKTAAQGNQGAKEQIDRLRKLKDDMEKERLRQERQGKNEVQT